MANVQHSGLTGSDLHEPKGVASATSGQVYVADGAGSGSWTDQATAGLRTEVSLHGDTISDGIISPGDFATITFTPANAANRLRITIAGRVSHTFSGANGSHSADIALEKNGTEVSKVWELSLTRTTGVNSTDWQTFTNVFDVSAADTSSQTWTLDWNRPTADWQADAEAMYFEILEYTP